ncbi:AAA family ATPase [Actinomyces oris]|uniref:AAA family ATPase n=1 Tax=Actinomyces oris TaxID=544580 RepID=A0AAW9KL91_9ACTO|nr:AAA family ATPase [Actinomyces oris]MEA1303922.1 AAA family ATPase [Actinomyces oris]
MRLTRVKVENHSRLQDLELEVRQHMVLIGPNDVGKSSLLRCLDLLLGASTGQLYNQITPEDLREPGHPFAVEADLCNFSDTEQALFPDEITVDPNGEKEQTLTIRLEATFDDNETLSITRTAPNKNTGRQISRNQLQAIGWTLLNANDRARNMSDDRHSLFDDVLAGVELGDEQADFDGLIDAIRGQLQSSNVLTKLRERMSDQLSTALPERVAQDDLTFVPGAAADNNVLDGVRLHVNDKSISEQSDGKRAIYAIALYDLISNGANVVAIDEPEIHLHPSSQRSLARLLKNGRNQKIIATHSPDIVSAFDPECIVSVKAHGKVVQPAQGLLNNDQRLILTWWVKDKLEPLTARHIIFVEGISDRIVLERVAELTGRELDRLGVTIMEVGGCKNMKHVWSLFGADGFDIPTSILIDEDAVPDVPKYLNIQQDEFEQNSVWVSLKDLEDEYVQALDRNTFISELLSSGMFETKKQQELETKFNNNTITDEDIAEFCRFKPKRHPNHKVAAASIVSQLLDESSASEIKSIMDLLNDIESA